MPTRRTRSISGPIVLGTFAVGVSIALLVGWILVVVASWDLVLGQLTGTWLMVAGIVSLAFIIATLVLFSVFLVREILETRRQTSFIDSVTHELRSPLTSLRLSVEALERPQLSDSQRREVHERMALDTERLALFVDDILAASRLPYERRGYQLREIDLEQLLRRCAAAIERRYRLEAQTIGVEVAAGLTISSDESALSIIVKNLLDNAVKYSEQPLHIDACARLDPRRGVQIEVRDRGIGLSPRDSRRIFERFYRVPEEQVRRRHGTGIGLFVASTLVKRLGGRIRAVSEGPGCGTTMRVTLPLGETGR